MAFGGFVHAMHYLLVLQVHIAVEVNFLYIFVLCKKDNYLSFSNTSCLHCSFSERILTLLGLHNVLWKSPLCT